MATETPKPARAPRKPRTKPAEEHPVSESPKAARAPRKPRATAPQASDTVAPPQPRTRRRSTDKPPAEVVSSSVPVPGSRPVVVDPDAYPGESVPGEASDKPFKLTVNIPQSLHERAAGLIWHADFTGGPEEVMSMTSLVRLALVETITKYEKKYNAGMAFPAPARLRRGRPPKVH